MSILSKHHNGNSDLPRVRFQIGGALTDSSRALQACGRPPLHLSRKRGRTLAGNMMTPSPSIFVVCNRPTRVDHWRNLIQLPYLLPCPSRSRCGKGGVSLRGQKIVGDSSPDAGRVNSGFSGADPPPFCPQAAIIASSPVRPGLSTYRCGISRNWLYSQVL